MCGIEVTEAGAEYLYSQVPGSPGKRLFNVGTLGFQDKPVPGG
jgi:hypothetical protein